MTVDEQIAYLPDDVKWSVEQIRAQCGRVIAGDSPQRGQLKGLAWFVQNELLDNLLPAIVTLARPTDPASR